MMTTNVWVKQVCDDERQINAQHTVQQTPTEYEYDQCFPTGME